MKVKATVTVDNEKHVILVDLDQETVDAVGREYMRQCDVADVLSYAKNEYGKCVDPEIARFIHDNAEVIAKEYRHDLDNDDNWFYVLESVVESFLKDNKEV